MLIPVVHKQRAESNGPCSCHTYLQLSKNKATERLRSPGLRPEDVPPPDLMLLLILYDKSDLIMLCNDKQIVGTLPLKPRQHILHLRVPVMGEEPPQRLR